MRNGGFLLNQYDLQVLNYILFLRLNYSQDFDKISCVFFKLIKITQQYDRRKFFRQTDKMGHKTAYYFEFHKTFYLIKIGYSTKSKKIKIAVQVNISNQIYFLRLYQNKLPIQIAFYVSLDNLYLALQKSQDINFNLQQKRFQFEDLINGKPTKIGLQMRNRKSGLTQKNNKGRHKKSRLYKEQHQQFQLLKLRYSQAEQNILKMTNMIKQNQSQLFIYQNQLKSQKLKFVEIKRQNEQLREYCRFYKKLFPQYTKQFDIYLKRRKDSDTSCSKDQNPSPQVINLNIIEEQRIDSKMQNQQRYESQENFSSFLIQIDEEQFKRALNTQI